MGAKLTYPQSEIPADKTFIVTGGNAGIGYQTTKCIAKLGGRVIIACRNEEKATQAIEKMQKEHKEEVNRENEGSEGKAKKPAAPATKEEGAAASADKDEGAADTVPEVQPLKVEFMKVDLASLASTMEFVNAYKAKGYPLHVLICNAGLGLVPYQKTDDGFEIQFETNYLSHFLMTLHLLPLLRESAPNSRIVNLTSIMHQGGSFDLKNMQGESSFDRIKFYGNSKVYQIMNMYALTRRLKGAGISIISVHPGYVDSNFKDGSADSKIHSFFESVSKTLNIKRSVADGAMTSLVAALDSSYNDRSGIYLKDCKVATPSGLSRNIDKQEQLWDYSIDLLKDHITDDLMKDLQLTKDKNAAPAAAAASAKTEEAPAKTEEAASNEVTKAEVAESEQVAEAESKDNTKEDDAVESKAQDEAESTPDEKVEAKPEGKEAKTEEASDLKPEENGDSKPEESDSKPEDSKPEDEVETETKKDEEMEKSEPAAEEGGKENGDTAENNKPDAGDGE